MRLAFLFCRPRYERQFFKILLHRACGSTPEDDAFSSQDLFRQDAALASYHRSGFDSGVIAYAYLAAHDYVVFDGYAAGKAGLRGY